MFCESNIRKFQNKYRVDSVRLNDYDYSSDGFYFVTICTKDKINYFGNVVNSGLELSRIGKIAEKCWQEIPKHFPFVTLDKFVVMPNHLHGIIMIDRSDKHVETQDFAPLQDNAWQPNRFGPQSKNLASIIRGLKIGVTKYANEHKIEFKWQRRYYDHIIRNQKSLENIREYIINNPINWDNDRNNFEKLFM